MLLRHIPRLRDRSARDPNAHFIARSGYRNQRHILDRTSPAVRHRNAVGHVPAQGRGVDADPVEAAVIYPISDVIEERQSLRDRAIHEAVCDLYI